MGLLRLKIDAAVRIVTNPDISHQDESFKMAEALLKELLSMEEEPSKEQAKNRPAQS